MVIDLGGEAGRSHNLPASVLAQCVEGTIYVVGQYCRMFVVRCFDVEPVLDWSEQFKKGVLD